MPFCFHKCHYCDFYSIVDPRDRQESFLIRLESELTAIAPWAAGRPLETIFVGGGTPSLLRPDLWRRLLALLADRFDLSVIKARAGEFTVECNPETVTQELMGVLAAGGVTRVSLGAQSFNPTHLKTLERWHNPDNVPLAIDRARRAGIARQSIDLIYAIPGQSLDEWAQDLRAALALGTEHLSCYALTYEPATAMTARLARGEFARADEDLEADMFEHTLRTLRAAGLERYEVSNFAKPGAECRHNLAYWRQEDWLAAGPAASGHLAGHRWKNIPRLDDYLAYNDHGFAPIVDHEPPDPARALRERVMTGLRLREGIDADRVRSDAARQNPAAAEKLSRARDALVARAWLTEADGRWALTDAGMLFADRASADLMRAIDSPSPRV